MNWKDITLRQFNRIKELDLKELDGQIEAASILLDMNVDDMKWSEFCKELNRLNFLSEPVQLEIVRPSYTVNGRKYLCDPYLNNLNVGRYMDFTNLVKTGSIEKILAVFLIPEGKEYGDYDVDKVYEDILDMSIVDVQSIYNHFRLQFTICIRALKDYSVKNLKKNRELQKIVSQIMESSPTFLD